MNQLVNAFNYFINNLPFIVLFITLLIICFYLIIYYLSMNLEKRIGKYSVESIKDKEISLFDTFYDFYINLRSKLTSLLKKIPLFKKYSLKYNKYITYENEKYMCSMDYISNKIFISFLFIVLTAITNIIAPNMFGFSSFILFAIIGFFIIDIYFMFYDYVKKRQVERDLLNAIIIMNNAFRSGKSMIQAIEIVSKELTGPISQEFKKMHLEISYGLSLDVVFDRFSKRVSSKEVSYITSSLSILNKTGGNIIKVFSSIEKMLFNKRKLKEEMKSLTSSSRLISIVLLSLPVIFTLIMLILNKHYFDPLFLTLIGNIILFFIIVLYIAYIIIVIKIMKVRFD